MQIESLSIGSNNLSVAKNFYADTLGFVTHEINQEELLVQIGSSILRLYRSENPGQHHFAMNIPYGQIHAAENWLSSRCRLVSDAQKQQVVSFENWSAKALYFFDQDAHILEFISRRDFPGEVKEPFSAASIMCISEIGLVHPQPLALSKEIHHRLQVELFDKGPAHEQFVACGNDEGLFVISSPHRNWYPTACPAQLSELRFVIQQDGHRFAYTYGHHGLNNLDEER